MRPLAPPDPPPDTQEPPPLSPELTSRDSPNWHLVAVVSTVAREARDQLHARQAMRERREDLVKVDNSHLTRFLLSPDLGYVVPIRALVLVFRAFGGDGSAVMNRVLEPEGPGKADLVAFLLDNPDLAKLVTTDTGLANKVLLRLLDGSSLVTEESSEDEKEAAKKARNLFLDWGRDFRGYIPDLMGKTPQQKQIAEAVAHECLRKFPKGLPQVWKVFLLRALEIPYDTDKPEFARVRKDREKWQYIDMITDRYATVETVRGWLKGWEWSEDIVWKQVADKLEDSIREDEGFDERENWGDLHLIGKVIMQMSEFERELRENINGGHRAASRLYEPLRSVVWRDWFGPVDENKLWLPLDRSRVLRFTGHGGADLEKWPPASRSSPEAEHFNALPEVVGV